MKFQALSWHAEDVDDSYIIKVFGIDIAGKSVCLSLDDFTPYFYVKVPKNWTSYHANKFQDNIEAMFDDVSISKVKVVRKKDFWGFTNNEMFTFIRIDFNNLYSFKKLKYALESNPVVSSTLDIKKCKLYEANIDPFIRIIHIKGIKPSDWLYIPDECISPATVLKSTCFHDIKCPWNMISAYESNSIAKFKIASFDLECMSSHGDFPVPMKTYRRSANEIYDIFTTTSGSEYVIVNAIKHGMYSMFSIDDKNTCSKVYPKKNNLNLGNIKKIIDHAVDDIYGILTMSGTRDEKVSKLDIKFQQIGLPPLKGDEIITIGVTVHEYGTSECTSRYALTLGSCDDIDGISVSSFDNETDMILAFRSLIVNEIDPDVITGYNINGFDFYYLYNRCQELNIWDEFNKIGRLKDRECKYVEQRLSSSALGDNILKYIDAHGRVIIDLMKVIQRDYKLDSYKLDNVAFHFTKEKKHDISPNDIFRLQKGTSSDRRVIVEYCIQDCALCNLLVIKLEIMANNIGMSNVCLVPLSYIFNRGQGIKIFSLVMNECKDAGYLIPSLKYSQDLDDDSGYEGAIVLEPKPGIYIDNPVSVLDYASLYPSSMISENLSHDSLVLDSKYDNLPGVNYLNVSYDLYDSNKNKIGEKVCRYYQPDNNDKSLIPKILMKLLNARKSTRKKINMFHLNSDNNIFGWYNSSKHELVKPDGTVLVNIMPEDVTEKYNSFEKAVLDGLQNAYKITANSLYGQCGARTSPIYMKDIAACTTATGRRMILKAKSYLEENYDANIIYGDTDSIFVVFSNDAKKKYFISQKGHDAILPSINISMKASAEFRKTIKSPHDLEYEKTFWPFIILSKKRYVGNKYENDDVNFKQNSMGIVLKRRDNAPIVKTIYGGVIDIILNQQNIAASVEFLKSQLQRMESNNVSLEELVITKSLRSEYKDPSKIAHKVLADRMGDRDPGNRPQVNDRIPYIYIMNKNKSKKVLQGDRIEHIDYVIKNNIKPDIEFYITNQIMSPVCQLFSLVVDQIPKFSSLRRDYMKEYKKLLKTYSKDTAEDKINNMKESDVEKLLFEDVLKRLHNVNNGYREITSYFKPI